MMTTCIDCRWHNIAFMADDEQVVIECRRNPPTVVAFDDELLRSFPHVDDDDWCGEWEPVPTPIPDPPAPGEPTVDLSENHIMPHLPSPTDDDA